MVSERIGDMTPSELRAFVEAIIDERSRSQTNQQAGKRSVEEVLASIRKNVIIPKPGAPSVVDMLREDRDR